MKQLELLNNALNDFKIPLKEFSPRHVGTIRSKLVSSETPIFLIGLSTQAKNYFQPALRIREGEENYVIDFIDHCNIFPAYKQFKLLIDFEYSLERIELGFVGLIFSSHIMHYKNLMPNTILFMSHSLDNRVTKQHLIYLED